MTDVAVLLIWTGGFLLTLLVGLGVLNGLAWLRGVRQQERERALSDDPLEQIIRERTGHS